MFYPDSVVWRDKSDGIVFVYLIVNNTRRFSFEQVTAYRLVPEQTEFFLQAGMKSVYPAFDVKH